MRNRCELGSTLPKGVLVAGESITLKEAKELAIKVLSKTKDSNGLRGEKLGPSQDLATRASRRRARRINGFDQIGLLRHLEHLGKDAV